MDIRVGDVVTMKRPHPCGSHRWLVMRTGADFRLRCVYCMREVYGPRTKFEKTVTGIERCGEKIPIPAAHGEA